MSIVVPERSDKFCVVLFVYIHSQIIVFGKYFYKNFVFMF
jgi:hypothetical protein